MDKQRRPHILLVIFPIQSHITPALEFATRLIASGAFVTIVTTIAGAKSMNNSGSIPVGLSFATISDGSDDGFKLTKNAADMDAYMASYRRCGSETLSELIAAGPAAGLPPYTIVAYTYANSWVADVARRHNLPSALLWIQNTALFAIYYHYCCNGYSHIIDQYDENDPDWCVKLPSLPLLRAKDIPTLIIPSNPYANSRVMIADHFAQLKPHENNFVLVNSFDALDQEIIDSLKSRFRISTVGPLLPPSFLAQEMTSMSDTTFRVDMFERSKDDYLAWLDTQPNNSVVYISFGSISVLPKEQMEELAAALVEMGRPFLLVVRLNLDPERGDELPRKEELREKGMVVPWCSQAEVLLHKAVGCFVTHCGWNSTIESLAAGVPMVGVPQWLDQQTNAKMVEVWGTGIRAGAGANNVVGREEIRRCVEVVMESKEIRGAATKWREMAVVANKEGGSSEVNLRAFVDELWRMSESSYE